MERNLEPYLPPREGELVGPDLQERIQALLARIASGLDAKQREPFTWRLEYPFLGSDIYSVLIYRRAAHLRIEVALYTTDGARIPLVIEGPLLVIFPGFEGA